MLEDEACPVPKVDWTSSWTEAGNLESASVLILWTNDGDTNAGDVDLVIEAKVARSMH